MTEIGVSDPEMEEKKDGGPWATRPLGFQLFFAVGICLVLYVSLGALSGVFLKHFYGIGGSEMMNDVPGFLEMHGDRLNPYRWLQIASSILIFGFPALLMSYLITGRWFGFFRWSRKASTVSLLYLPLIMLCAFPVIMLVYSYVSEIPVPESFRLLEENLELFMDSLLRDPSYSTFALNFLMIAILPAVCEELFFRGMLQRLLTRVSTASSGPHIAILISGLVFGMIHGQVFKFLPIAVLGILLGYLYWWTKNLWFPILAHFFHNGIQVILYFALARGWVDMDVNAAEVLPPLQTALCTLLFVALLYLFYNANRKTADEPF